MRGCRTEPATRNQVQTAVSGSLLPLWEKARMRVRRAQARLCGRDARAPRDATAYLLWEKARMRALRAQARLPFTATPARALRRALRAQARLPGRKPVPVRGWAAITLSAALWIPAFAGMTAERAATTAEREPQRQRSERRNNGGARAAMTRGEISAAIPPRFFAPSRLCVKSRLTPPAPQPPRPSPARRAPRPRSSRPLLRRC